VRVASISRLCGRARGVHPFMWPGVRPDPWPLTSVPRTLWGQMRLVGTLDAEAQEGGATNACAERPILAFLDDRALKTAPVESEE
jgi:hypothetical protein